MNPARASIEVDPFVALREVLELFPVGVLLVSGDDPVGASRVAFNGAYARLLGIPEDTPPERAPLGSYYYPDRTTLLTTRDMAGRRAIATGEVVQNEEVHLLCRDGTWRVLLVSAAPVRHCGCVRGALVVFRDASELHAAKEEARAKAAQATSRAEELQAVLDTVPAAVFITRDRESRTMEVNRFGAELLGTAAASNVSLSAPSAERTARLRACHAGVEIPSEDLPMQVAARVGVNVTGAEVELCFDDGTVRHLLGNASPISPAEGGEPRGAVGAFVDITERRRMEEALRDADRRKDEFLATLSHELRNPLAPLQNACAILQRAEAGSDVAGRARDVIARQVRQLTRLVDDLLDVTRISRGKVQLVRGRADLAEIVRRTVEDRQPLLAQRGLALAVRGLDRPVPVEGDAARLSQVVANLLQNAAKFTDRGGHVSVALEHDDAAARVRVADDGAGMAPETIGLLFQPFMQAERTLDRSRGGLGLGLALVKGIVELHGGTVEGRSAGPGRGAEFVVTLPLGAAAAREPARRGRAVAGARRRILVVEDNLDAATTLRDVLELEGHEVLVAADGQRGFEAAVSERPDVVLCDIGLPVMDGYEVARRIRAAGSGALLIALTGYATPEDADRARRAGFDRHLGKPANLEDLWRLVGEASSTPRGEAPR